MQSLALLNVRSLLAADETLELLAIHMLEHSLQMLGLIETKLPHLHETTEDIHCLGYRLYAPSQTHPVTGGLAILHDSQWEPDESTTTYTTGLPHHNAERLLTTFRHRDKAHPPTSIMLVYTPPSLSLSDFVKFFEDTFAEIAAFQRQHDTLPVILTDANAHCLSGLDSMTRRNIPDRYLEHKQKPSHPTPQSARGRSLETMSLQNEYVILNNRAPGDSSAPTFQTRFRSSTVDYILVPAHQYGDIASLNILEGTSVKFNTDHNIIHMTVSPSSTPTPPIPIPNGLTDDALLFDPLALTDLNTRKSFQDAIEKRLRPWVLATFPAQVAHKLHNNTPIDDIAQYALDNVIGLTREAAIQTLPGKSPPRPNTNTLPHWWTPQLSALSSETNRIQNTVQRLRRRLPDNHDTVKRTTARLVALRRALRVSAARTRKHHSAAYYSTIARTIHKSILRPLQSNKAAWNTVQRRRRTNMQKSHIPTNMRGHDASHAQNPQTSAINWHTAWAGHPYTITTPQTRTSTQPKPKKTCHTSTHGLTSFSRTKTTNPQN